VPPAAPPGASPAPRSGCGLPAVAVAGVVAIAGLFSLVIALSLLRGCLCVEVPPYEPPVEGE
jgi:hypothetical protein